MVNCSPNEAMRGGNVIGNIIGNQIFKLWCITLQLQAI